MPVLEQIISTIAPYSCLVCEVEGAVLCAECRALIKPLPARCWRCRRASPNGKTRASCRSSSSLNRVLVATTYDDLAKQLVAALKFAGQRGGARVMAQHLSLLVAHCTPTAKSYIVHVPTATVRRRERGYDHAQLVARAVAQQTGVPQFALLARLGQARQVGTKRAQRLTQLQHSFRARQAPRILGAHIILVDDVLTTGATLEAAARTLRAAGATRVDALIFAQA